MSDYLTTVTPIPQSKQTGAETRELDTPTSKQQKGWQEATLQNNQPTAPPDPASGAAVADTPPEQTEESAPSETSEPLDLDETTPPVTSTGVDQVQFEEDATAQIRDLIGKFDANGDPIS